MNALAPNVRYTHHTMGCLKHRASGESDSIRWPYLCRSHLNSGFLQLPLGI